MGWHELAVGDSIKMSVRAWTFFARCGDLGVWHPSGRARQTVEHTVETNTPGAALWKAFRPARVFLNE
jgi:hypothetical protein